jgi:ABC-type glycerol-3-phosphate transport system substrate-binding protein
MAAPRRHRPLVALTALALALGLTGCGAASSEGGISGGGKVIGRTVTVYSLTSDPGGAGADFVAGEKLALADAGGRAGELAVNFTSLDLGGDDEKAQAQAARRAINDPQIIAAVADATQVTVPLFNAAGILQVAPGGDPSLASDEWAQPAGTPTVGTLPPVDVPADFATRFEREFGRPPGSGAEEGYRAMKGALDAIAEGGVDRTRVIKAYLGP